MQPWHSYYFKCLRSLLYPSSTQSADRDYSNDASVKSSSHDFGLIFRDDSFAEEGPNLNSPGRQLGSDLSVAFAPRSQSLASLGSAPDT